jgi:hypothetical protein
MGTALVVLGSTTLLYLILDYAKNPMSPFSTDMDQNFQGLDMIAITCCILLTLYGGLRWNSITESQASAEGGHGSAEKSSEKSRSRARTIDESSTVSDSVVGAPSVHSLQRLHKSHSDPGGLSSQVERSPLALSPHHHYHPHTTTTLSPDTIPDTSSPLSSSVGGGGGGRLSSNSIELSVCSSISNSSPSSSPMLQADNTSPPPLLGIFTLPSSAHSSDRDSPGIEKERGGGFAPSLTSFEEMEEEKESYVV